MNRQAPRALWLTRLARGMKGISASNKSFRETLRAKFLFIRLATHSIRQSENYLKKPYNYLHQKLESLPLIL